MTEIHTITSATLPLLADFTDKSRSCIYCKNLCIDENEPIWKTTCGDCFLSEVLPKKAKVDISRSMLDQMTFEELSELPMTWGKKYSNMKLRDVPFKYWEFVSKNSCFYPQNHLHVYLYMVRMAQKIKTDSKKYSNNY